MKLLLRKNVRKLGIVGDVVHVASGYARNYLIPQGLAVSPTRGNMRALAKARELAEQELAEQRAMLAGRIEKLANFEVTLAAPANEDGVLYGSVGRREIAAALRAAGHDVDAEHVQLQAPIRHLDNVTVQVQYEEDLTASVKVWVVRERGGEDEAEGHDEDPHRTGDGTGENRGAPYAPAGAPGDRTGAGMEADAHGDAAGDVGG
ncbi:MAG: 50S ribosomal protein L9 [Phycisphaerae bacterium]